MKKIALVVSRAYQNNRIFDLTNPFLNRDNCLYPFYILKKHFAEEGYELSTQDINTINQADKVIYNEMPARKKIMTEKSYLLIFESELIRPDNWNKHNHKKFKSVFTWCDDLANTKNYIKFNFPQPLPNDITPKQYSEKKLCTLISGNKKVNHPLELYSKREQSISWFEQNHLSDFDLYGVGWGRYYFRGKYLAKVLNKINWLTRLLVVDHSSYKGIVDSKHQILQSYKFAVCYENAKDIPGYITEKIFDCFFSECIPIYWGANNITQHIPASCFIDRTKFETHEALYLFLNNMGEVDYQSYQTAIKEFLLSDSFTPFSTEFFSKNIVTQVIQ